MKLRFPATGTYSFSATILRKLFTIALATASLLFFISAMAPVARAQNFSDPSKWELGGHYALLNLPYQCTGLTNCQSGSSGFGGNLTYNMWAWISLDSEMDFYPDNGNPATMLTGGQMTEALFGFRVGPTTRKWGFYSVLRPGFVSFSRTLGSSAPTGSTSGAAQAKQFRATLFAPDAFRAPGNYSQQAFPMPGQGFARDTDFALNYGEAIVYRPTKHLALRFDVGDTIVSYPGVSILGPFKAHNFQIAQAFVIRF